MTNSKRFHNSRSLKWVTAIVLVAMAAAEVVFLSSPAVAAEVDSSMQPQMIKRVIGTDAIKWDDNIDGKSAPDVDITEITNAAADAGGNIYALDLRNQNPFSSRVLKIDPAGNISVVAGGGSQQPTPGGIDASKWDLYKPWDIAMDADGRPLIASGSGTITRIDEDGKARLVAGGGETSGAAANGRDALDARFSGNSYMHVDVGPDGLVYIAEADGGIVWRVDHEGNLDLLMDSNELGVPAFGPTGVAVGPDGTVYASDEYNSKIWARTTSGSVTTFAGNGTRGSKGNGGPAANAELDRPAYVAADAAGNVYFREYATRSIRAVDTNRTLRHVAEAQTSESIAGLNVSNGRDLIWTEFKGFPNSGQGASAIYHGFMGDSVAPRPAPPTEAITVAQFESASFAGYANGAPASEMPLNPIDVWVRKPAEGQTPTLTFWEGTDARIVNHFALEPICTHIAQYVDRTVCHMEPAHEWPGDDFRATVYLSFAHAGNSIDRFLEVSPYAPDAGLRVTLTDDLGNVWDASSRWNQQYDQNGQPGGPMPSIAISTTLPTKIEPGTSVSGEVSVSNVGGVGVNDANSPTELTGFIPEGITSWNASGTGWTCSTDPVDGPRCTLTKDLNEPVVAWDSAVTPERHVLQVSYDVPNDYMQRFYSWSSIAVTSDNYKPGAGMGGSVAVSGNTVIAGAPLDSQYGNQRGRVYFYSTASGEPVRTNIVASKSDGDRLGSDVAVDGDIAVIGSSHSNANGSNSGEAFVYERESDGKWREQQSLKASDGSANDHFGTGVAIDADTIVVGAPNKGTGAVYVYEKTGGQWVEANKLTVSDASGGRFGEAVAVEGDKIVAGRRGDTHGGPWTGSAYVFGKENVDWVEQQKLTASTPAAHAHYGKNVDISSDGEVDRIVVTPLQGGRVHTYVMEGTSWVEEQIIPVSGAWAGLGVSLDGNRLAVGAPGSSSSSAPGHVTLHEHDGSAWSESETFQSPAGHHGDFYGWSIGMDDGMVAIGAKGHNNANGNVEIQLPPRGDDFDGTIPGLTGSYFTNTSLAGNPAMTRQDADINYDWGKGGPITGVVDNFSIRWDGQITSPVTGAVEFRTGSDDGHKVFVDDTLQLEDWTVTGYRTQTTSISMEAGKARDLRFEYKEHSGDARATLEWKLPGTTNFVPVPPSALSTSVTEEATDAAIKVARNVRLITHFDAPTGNKYLWSAATKGDIAHVTSTNDVMLACLACAPDLSLTGLEVEGGAAALPGDSLSATVHIENVGNFATDAPFSIEVDLPGAGELVSFASSNPAFNAMGCSADGSRITCVTPQGASLAEGASADFTFFFRLSDDAEPGESVIAVEIDSTETVPTAQGETSQEAPFQIWDPGVASFAIAASHPGEAGTWNNLDDGTLFNLEYGGVAPLRLAVTNASGAPVEAGETATIEVQLPPGVELDSVGTGHETLGWQHADEQWVLDSTRTETYEGDSDWTTDTLTFTAEVARVGGAPAGEALTDLVLNLRTAQTYGDALESLRVYAEVDVTNGEQLSMSFVEVGSQITGAPDGGVDVAAEVTHRFVAGLEGTIQFRVDNPTQTAVDAPIQLHVPWEENLQYVSATGGGWDCDMLGNELVCMNATDLEAETALANLDVTARAADDSGHAEFVVWPTVTAGTATMVEPTQIVTPAKTQVGDKIQAHAGETQYDVPALVLDGGADSMEIDWSSDDIPSQELVPTKAELNAENTIGGFEGEPLEFEWRQLCLTPEAASAEEDCFTGVTPPVTWLDDEGAPTGTADAGTSPARKQVIEIPQPITDTTFLLFEVTASNDVDSSTDVVGVEVVLPAEDESGDAIMVADPTLDKIDEGASTHFEVPLEVHDLATRVKFGVTDAGDANVVVDNDGEPAGGPNYDKGDTTVVGLTVDTAGVAPGMHTIDYAISSDQSEDITGKLAYRVDAQPLPATPDTDFGELCEAINSGNAPLEISPNSNGGETWTLSFAEGGEALTTCEPGVGLVLAGASIAVNAWLDLDDVEGSLDEYGLTIGQAGVELPSDWGIDGVRVDPDNPLFIGWDGTLRGSIIATDVPFVRGIEGETRIDLDVTYQGADSITLNAQATPFPATTVTMSGAIGISGGFDVDVEVAVPAATVSARINQHDIDAGITFEPGGDLDGFTDWLGDALADGLNPVEKYHQSFCDIWNLAAEDEIPSFATTAGFRFYTDDLTPAGADCTDPAATIAMTGGTVVTYPWLTFENADATFHADGSVVVHSGTFDLAGSLGADWGLPTMDVTEDVTLHADGQLSGMLVADAVPFVEDALDWLNTPGQFNVDLGTTTTVTADVVVTEGLTIALGGSINIDGTFGLAVDVTTPHGSAQATITRDHVDADIVYLPASTVTGVTKWVLAQLDDTVNQVDAVDLTFCDVWEMAATGALTSFATDSGWRVFPTAGTLNATGADCTAGNANVDMTGGRIALFAWLGLGNVTAEFSPDGKITVADAEIDIDGNWQVDNARIDDVLVLGTNGIESGSIDLGTVPFLSEEIAGGSAQVVFNNGVASLDVDAQTTFNDTALDIEGTVAGDGSIDLTITAHTPAGPVTGSLGFDADGAAYVTAGTTTQTIQDFIVDNLYDLVWSAPANGLDFCEIWTKASIGDTEAFGSDAGWNFFPADGQFTATDGTCADGDATVRMTGGTIALFSWLGITNVDATIETDGTVTIAGGTATLPADWELTGIQVDEDDPIVLDADGLAHGTLATDGTLPFLGDSVPADLTLGGTHIVLGESNGKQSVAVDSELTVAGEGSDTGIVIRGDVGLDGSFDLGATVTIVIDGTDFVIEGSITRADPDGNVVVDISGEFADPIWFDDDEANGITDLGFELSTNAKLKLNGTLHLGVGSMFSTSIPLSIEWQRMENNEWRFRHDVDIVVAGNPLGLAEDTVVDGEVEYEWKFWGGKSSFKLLSLEGDHTNSHWNPTPSIDVVDFDLSVETNAEGDTTGYAAAATIDWRGYNADGSLTEPYTFTASGSYDLDKDELALRVDTDDEANAGRMVPLMPNIFIGRVHLDMTWNPDDGFQDEVEIEAFLGIGGLLSATVTFKGSIMSDSGKMLVTAELGEKHDAWEGAVREIGVGFRHPTFVYSPVNNDARLSETIDPRMPDLYNFNGLAFAGFVDWGQWGSGGPSPSSKFLAKITLPGFSAGTGFNAMGFDLRMDLPQSGPAMLYGSEDDINTAETAAWVGGAGLRIAKNPDGLSVGLQLEAHVQYPTDLTEEGYDRMTIIGGITYGLGQGSDLFEANMGNLAKAGTALFKNGDIYIYLKMHQRHDNAFGVEGLRINELELSYGSVSRGVDCQAGPGQSDDDLNADCFDADGAKIKDRYPLGEQNPHKPKSPNKRPGTTVGLYADVTLPTEWREAVGMHEDVSTVAAFAIGANWCVAIEVGTPGSTIPAIQPLQGDAKDKLTLYYGRFVYAPRGCTIGDHAYYGYNFDLEGDLLDVPIQLSWELKITNIEALGAFGPMVWSNMRVDVGEFKINDSVKIDRTVVASSFVHFMGVRSTEFELQGGLNIGENELSVKLNFVNNLGFSKDQALKMLTGDFNVVTAMSESLKSTGLFLHLEAHMHLEDDVTTYQSLTTLGLWAIQDLDLYMSFDISLGAAPQLIGSMKFTVWLFQQHLRVEAGIDFSDWKLNHVFGRMAVEPQLPGLESSGGSAMFRYERGEAFEAKIGDWCSFITDEDYDDVVTCDGPQEALPDEQTATQAAVTVPEPEAAFASSAPEAAFASLAPEGPVQGASVDGVAATNAAVDATPAADSGMAEDEAVVEAIPAAVQTSTETEEETGPKDPGSMSGEELEEWLGDDGIEDADWEWLEPTIEMEPFRLVVGDWELGRVAGVITADYLALEAAIQLSPIGKPSRIEGRIVYGTDDEALEGFQVRNRQGEYVQASPGDVMLSAENIGYPIADWLSLTGDLHLGWLSDNGHGESEFYVDIAAQLAVLGTDVEVSGSFSSLGVFHLRGELAGLTVMGYGLDSLALEVNGDGSDVSTKLSAAIDLGIAGIDFEGELGVENGVPGARLDGSAFVDFGAGFGADANVRFSTFPSDFGLRGDISMDLGDGTVTADGALTVTGSGDYWVSGNAQLNVPWGIAEADAGFTFTNCTDAACEATTTPRFGLTTTIGVGGFNFHLLADVRANGSFWVEAASYGSTSGSGGWGPFSYGWDLSYAISLELGWKDPAHNPINNPDGFDLAFNFAGQASAWGEVDLWLTNLRGSESAGVCGSFDLDGNLDFGLDFRVVGHSVEFGSCW